MSPSDFKIALEIFWPQSLADCGVKVYIDIYSDSIAARLSPLSCPRPLVLDHIISTYFVLTNWTATFCFPETAIGLSWECGCDLDPVEIVPHHSHTTLSSFSQSGSLRGLLVSVSLLGVRAVTESGGLW